jgi:hypothetical protein
VLFRSLVYCCKLRKLRKHRMNGVDRIFITAVAVILVLVSAATHFPEAPTGFDNKTNGIVDDVTHQADQVKFEGVEQLSDGLGPLTVEYVPVFRFATTPAKFRSQTSLNKSTPRPSTYLPQDDVGEAAVFDQSPQPFFSFHQRKLSQVTAV